MSEYAFPDYVVQMDKHGDNFVADFFVMPQVFEPVNRIVAASWYDAEEDNGKMMLDAFVAIQKTKDKMENDAAAE